MVPTWKGYFRRAKKMAIGGENGETVGGYFRAAECLGSHYNLRVKECFCGGLSWAHFNMLQH